MIHTYAEIEMRIQQKIFYEPNFSFAQIERRSNFHHWKSRLAEAQAELELIESILQEKQAALAAVEKKARDLQMQYDAAVKRLGDLEYTMALSEARLGRSGRLTSALADEEVRWIVEVAVSFHFTCDRQNNLFGKLINSYD